MIIQLLLNALATAGIYVLMGLGLSLIYRVSKVFHFAHGAIYTFAAYILYTCIIFLHLPLMIGVLLAIITTSILGYSIDRMIYQRLSRRRVTGATLLIASLGIYIFIENFIGLLFGSDIQVLLPGVQKTFRVGTAVATGTQIAEISAFILVLGSAIWIKRRSIGLQLRSTANDRTMSLAIGLSVTRIRAVSFIIGSGLAAIAACLASMDSGADPHMGMQALFVGIVAVFVGGPDIFLAPIIGGLFFSVLKVGANFVLSSRWESTIAFVVLLLFMAFRPEGILGKKRRIEEKTTHN